MCTKPYYPYRMGLFVCLSLGDLALTSHLLAPRDGQIFEANPIARWWLDGFGWAGLAGFKVAMVLLVCGLALAISRYRPSAGRRLITFACSTVAAVLAYSVCLAGTGGARHLWEETRTLNQRSQDGRYFLVRSAQLSKALVEGRCTLAEAVRELAPLPRSHEFVSYIKRRYRCRGLSRAEWMAVSLLDDAREIVRDQPERAQIEQRLRSDFRAVFGKSAPELLTPFHSQPAEQNLSNVPSRV
jgi:hypothetical protein